MEFFDGVAAFANPVYTLLRSIFFFIDSIIFGFVPIVYDFAKTLIDIEGLIGNEDDVLRSVANNIYALLAIVMFFRLGFSLLYMLADPDKIEDKEKGFSKLITSVIGCLVLILVMPYIFSFATRLQTTILENNAIEGIFLGDISYCTDYDYSLEDNSASCITPNLGMFVSRAVLSMFIFPTNGVNASDDATGSYERFTREINDDNAFFEIFSFGKYLNDSSSVLGFGTYHFTYIPILSTIVGLYVIWIFITFALDIAYRSLKLFVLKLISPIAIVSFIDPDSAKKGIFKKWVEEAVKTYLSLFIRIAALALASLVILSINWSGISNIFAKLFLLLGALTLMKTMPKMFEKIFGYQAKTKEESFGKSMLAGALGGLAASGAGAISGGMSAKAHGLKFSDGSKTGAWEGLKAGGQAGYKGGAAGVGKSMFAGGAAVGKAFDYPTGYAAFKDKLQKKEMKADSMAFKKAKDQSDLLFLEEANDNDFLNYINSNESAAIAASHRASFSGLNDAQKAQYKERYAESKFYNSLSTADKSDYARINHRDVRAKKQYRSSYGKAQAFDQTIGPVDSKYSEALVKNEKLSMKKAVQESEVSVAKEKTSDAQILLASDPTNANYRHDYDLAKDVQYNLERELSNISDDIDKAKGKIESYDKNKEHIGGTKKVEGQKIGKDL